MISSQDIGALKAFLYDAKRNTYANPDAAPTVNPVDLTSEFEYSSGAFNYRDRYFGNNPFCGQEIVFKKNTPYWAMNYYGLVTDTAVKQDMVFSFLKQAMMGITPELPLRGPETYSQGDWQYIDHCEGDVSRFSGKERILYQGRDVYFHTYHGGLVIS